MADKKFTDVKIVSASGQEHAFFPIQDFQIKVEAGFIDVNLAAGNFVIPLDNLRYFAVGLAHPQDRPARFRLCEVKLTAPKETSHGVGAPPQETVRVKDVVKYDWKTDHGLFLIFGKRNTVGIHLDHVISFTLEDHP